MKDLGRRRARVARIQAKKPRTTAAIVAVVVDVDPVRRIRIGDALLRLLNSTGTPDNNGR